MSKAAYFASGNRATEQSPATSRRASQVPSERMSKRLSDSPLEQDPDDEEAADYKEPTDAEAGEVKWPTRTASTAKARKASNCTM
jgi:hypothetical protein